MDLITFEHETFKQLQYNIEQNLKTTQAIYAKLAAKSEDNWLSPTAAEEYTGFKKAWLIDRAAEIGCFKDGKGLRFKKSNIDKYMLKNSFGPK